MHRKLQTMNLIAEHDSLLRMLILLLQWMVRHNNNVRTGFFFDVGLHGTMHSMTIGLLHSQCHCRLFVNPTVASSRSECILSETCVLSPISKDLTNQYQHSTILTLFSDATTRHLNLPTRLYYYSSIGRTMWQWFDWFPSPGHWRLKTHSRKLLITDL